MQASLSKTRNNSPACVIAGIMARHEIMQDILGSESESDMYDPDLYEDPHYGELFDAYGEDDMAYGFDENETKVDLGEYRESAWQRLYQHYVCSLGSSANPSIALLTEAELHMQAADYRQALICALATESIDGSMVTRRMMIQLICIYQLGDRTAACELKETLGDDADESGISPYLYDRYKGTCEVLGMMPDLLSMLRGLSEQ